jgi:hypothetical protein
MAWIRAAFSGMVRRRVLVNAALIWVTQGLPARVKDLSSHCGIL